MQVSPGRPPLLVDLATELIALPASRKGRYALLHALAARTGAQSLIRQHPAILAECLHAMREDAASAASDLLRSLLTSLHVELMGASGAEATGAEQPGRMPCSAMQRVV